MMNTLTWPTCSGRWGVSFKLALLLLININSYTPGNVLLKHKFKSIGVPFFIEKQAWVAFIVQVDNFLQVLRKGLIPFLVNACTLGYLLVELGQTSEDCYFQYSLKLFSPISNNLWMKQHSSLPMIWWLFLQYLLQWLTIKASDDKSTLYCFCMAYQYIFYSLWKCQYHGNAPERTCVGCNIDHVNFSKPMTALLTYCASFYITIRPTVVQWTIKLWFNLLFNVLLHIQMHMDW